MAVTLVDHQMILKALRAYAANLRRVAEEPQGLSAKMRADNNKEADQYDELARRFNAEWAAANISEGSDADDYRRMDGIEPCVDPWDV